MSTKYLLISILLLGACVAGDPVAPDAPRAPGGLSLALGPALAACDPSGVRQTMATLYPTNVFKQVALPTFNAAEQYRGAGEYALARTQYFTLIDNLIGRYKNDVLLTPSLQPSTQAGVHYVVKTVLACAGDVPAVAHAVVGRTRPARHGLHSARSRRTCPQ